MGSNQFRAAGSDTAARRRDQKKWDACPLWKKRGKALAKRRLQILLGRCDALWTTIGGLDAMMASGEVRLYCTDGLWVHPCGKVWHDGRDGDVGGIEHCGCRLCSELRLHVSINDGISQ